MSVGNFLLTIISHGIAFLYPSYRSFKAINSGEEVPQLEWLMYWTVIGIFAFGELFADIIIGWVPLYYEGKLLILLWLSFGGGAATLYRGVLHHYLTKHEKQIDESLSEAARRARGSLANFGKGLVKMTRHRSASVIQSVTEHILLDPPKEDSDTSSRRESDHVPIVHTQIPQIHLMKEDLRKRSSSEANIQKPKAIAGRIERSRRLQEMGKKGLLNRYKMQ